MQTYSPKSGEALENEEMLLVLQQALTKPDAPRRRGGRIGRQGLTG